MDTDPPSQNQIQPENVTGSVSMSDEEQPLQKASEPSLNPPPVSTTHRSDVDCQAGLSHEPSITSSPPLASSSGSTGDCEPGGSSGDRETQVPIGSRGTRGHVSNRRSVGRGSRGSTNGPERRRPLNSSELMEEHGKLVWRYNNAVGTVREQGRDIMCLEAELAKLKSHNELLNSDIERYRRDLKALDADLIQSNDKNCLLKNAIANMHASNSSMITDAQISTDYQYLISQIKNWIFSHFCDATPKHTKKTIADFGIKSDANDMTATAARKYLKEDSKRRFLVIGMLVMRYLDEHIFRKFLFGLADPDERCLSNLGEHFKKTATPKGVRLWCSTTAQMISATERHSHEVQERKNELVVQLESLLVNTIPQDGDMKDRVDDLKVIVDQAADLALALSVQRAEYFLHSPPPGEPFTSCVESAEVIEEGGDPGKGRHKKEDSSNRSKTQEKIIELTVYPGLFKKGNDDGEKYDEIVYVCNAKALQKAPEKSMISRGLSAVGLSS